jgi:hypothetical protein
LNKTTKKGYLDFKLDGTKQSEGEDLKTWVEEENTTRNASMWY